MNTSSVNENTDIFWIVKLPPEWKELFEKQAKQEGDNTHGAGARQLRRFIKSHLDVEAEA
jgi:hypothetical protein